MEKKPLPASGASVLLLGPETQTFMYLCVMPGSLCPASVRLESPLQLPGCSMDRDEPRLARVFPEVCEDTDRWPVPPPWPGL